MLMYMNKNRKIDLELTLNIMKREQIRPGNPDDIYEFLSQNGFRSQTREHRDLRNAYRYTSRPETVPCDFEDMYSIHFDKLAHRINKLEQKAIELLASQIFRDIYPFKISLEQHQYWYDIKVHGQSIKYSIEVKEKFYKEFVEDSEYYKVLTRTWVVIAKYKEVFPEYFI